MGKSNDCLSSLFERRFGRPPEGIAPMPESGSSRKYCRMSGGGSACIGVEGSNAQENAAFVYLAGHFRSRGINVPEVYAVSEDGLAYIQQDLGTVSLFDAVAQGRARAQEGGTYSEAEEELLCRTLAKLPQIQFEGAEGLDFGRCFPVPAMSVRSIMFDLNYFKYCYLLPSGLEYDEARLQDEFEALAADLLSEPYDTFMYRDFQTRNVMVSGGEPWFIDFQGGRRGPIHYDVASFVWQARSCFPPALRERMIDAYLDALGRYRPAVREEFTARLRLFLLFRTMQVLGAYGFRGLFQRKPHFIRSIPYALANLRELLSEPFAGYPYLSHLLAELSRQGCTAGEAAGRASEGAGRDDTAAGGEKRPSARERVGDGDEKCPSEQDGIGIGGGERLSEQDRIGIGGGEHPSAQSGAGQRAGEPGRLTVKVTSFSFKEGIPQDDSGNGGGYVFDCRGMNNPGRYERYRHSTGRDADVVEFLETDGGVFAFLEGVYVMVDPHVETFLRRGFTSLCVNFGCTGGQHRSVYCAEALARHIAGKFPAADVLLRHTKLGIGKLIPHTI